MELVFTEEFEAHEFIEEVGLPLPLIESNESWALPIEVGDTSGTNGDVLPSFGICEFNDLQVIRMIAFLKIAKFISKPSFFFD